MLTTEALLRISKEVGAPVSRVETTVGLLESGATVPFIARYRKEATGNLDEVKVRDIDERRLYYEGLEERRKTVLGTIESQGKLTEELKQRILACYVRSELEDLYLPYKPKRKTKATTALEKGLGPLAEYIWEQTGTDPVGVFAQQFVVVPQIPSVPEFLPVPSLDVPVASDAPAQSEAKSPNPRIPAGPASVEEAIEGALHILAERIAETAAFRRQLREKLVSEGVVRAKVAPGKEAEKTKYDMYYKFEETVPRIPSHRILAIRRGTRENVLTYAVETDGEKFIAGILPQVIRDSASQFAPFLDVAVRDSYERLLAPSLQNEIRSMLRERAEEAAIHVFEENLRSLLLSAPAGPVGLIGLDPGLRTGCKIAVVDETGRFLENQTIYPAEPRKDVEGAEKILVELVQKYNSRGIVIGNGTGSRETESFVRDVVAKHGLAVFVVVVNEAGASVYSASPRAREEFPSLDLTVRGAISIARRLQDPLAELVKIEPKSIGVGQYQHDVDQKKLKVSLAAAVESCVNRVGVDLNTASVDLLKYVSGINDKLATNIVARRTENGMFRSRTQLVEIEGFGEKTFEQAAGFLRIKDGENPLDRTAVHPESYPIVERMAASIGVPVGELIENRERIQSVAFKTFEAEAGKFTITDIREELLKPGRDPREQFVVAKFRDDVKEMGDLKEGMELEGAVTNVTNFGAFVDLGVHQDGLVHISELSHKYIQDAREAVKVGDIVKVKVIGVDAKMKRISLSIKALIPKPQRPPKPLPPKRKLPIQQAPSAQAHQAQAAHQAHQVNKAVASAPRPVLEKTTPVAKPKPVARPPVPAPVQTMEEKIRALQAKFGKP
jgi:protein Tex